MAKIGDKLHTSTRSVRRPSLKQLEAFRQTLPEYRQWESFRFLTWAWDVVLAHYFIARCPHPISQLNVASAARAYGFDQHVANLKAYQANPAQIRKWNLTLVYVDEQVALSDLVDLGRPLILAQVPTDTNKTTCLLIDGHHRLFKAVYEGRDHLPCVLLTEQEERLCRV